jgi:uncharacterized protein YabN with tetrapyrrole methylase and pyrophosphatase domain
MQVVLHAQVAEDNGEFTIEDVFASIASKLIRRHPHVFGELQVEGADEVLRNWETLKKQERGDEPLLDHVPTSMPALMQAQSVQSRAEEAGLAPPAPDATAIVEWIRALSAADAHASPESLGELLVGIVALARERGLDAEDALRSSILRYREDVARAESTRRTAP